MSKCPSKPPYAPLMTQKPVTAANPTMQNNKRTFSDTVQETPQPCMQPFAPKPARPPFPPRGTAPRPMRSNTAMQENQEEEIDYNDIHALQAFVARVQQSRNTDNYEYDQYEESNRPMKNHNRTKQNKIKQNKVKNKSKMEMIHKFNNTP